MNQDRNDESIIERNYINKIDRDPLSQYRKKITDNENEDDVEQQYQVHISSSTCVTQIVAFITLAAFTFVGLYIIFCYFDLTVSFTKKGG